ncbi:MAG: ISLre2 family transposase [Xenococcaceae cyanobacterium]
MNQKILANLNLNQSLEEFQVGISKLLKLERVTEWTGITIKEREEKIREAALILAGQCVAILLDNLSRSREAKETALNLTRGWWRKKTKKNGCKTWQILTVGNVIVKLKLPYVVEIKKRKDYKIKLKGQGFCPFLRWLGMEEAVTPYVWFTVAKYGTITTSFSRARQTLKDWGVKINLKRIQRLTYRFGTEGLSLRNSKILALEKNSLPTSSLLKDKRVVISVDGGRTRVRIYQDKKLNPKTQRKKYTGEWIEPKLLTIYTVDEKGKKMKTGEFPLINDGTYGNYKQFLKILEMYLVSLGISQAKQILLIADGAEWIWQHIPPLLNRLGCEEKIHYLLDFYHATEHLQSFADAGFNDEKESKAWFTAARSDLKKGKIVSLIEQMKQYRKSVRGSRRQILTSQINYFSKRVSKGLFDYNKISQLNLPIGSGAVESLIRQAVNLRLKGNGKFWLQHNAEIILHARCQWLSGNWNNFTDSILTSRIYPA